MDDVSGSGKKRHKYHEALGGRLLVGLRGKKAGIAAGKEYKGISLYTLEASLPAGKRKSGLPSQKSRPLLHMLAAQRAG